MIEIPRALARTYRAVLRRSLMDQEGRPAWPLVLCRAGPDGLTLESRRNEVAVRYQLQGERPSGVLAFQATLLAQFEGRDDSSIQLDEPSPGRGVARWADRGVPRAVEFETVTPDSAPEMPLAPGDLVGMPDDFRWALAEAARTTGESSRYGLTRIQLRGRAGEVAATDGRQLFMQRGFSFPWKDDVLVPRVNALGGRELDGRGPVHIGRAKDHIVVRVGTWTFWLAIDGSSRFPAVREVIPGPSPTASRLHLEEEDAAFLASTLPRLPGGNEGEAPITLDLATPPTVRANVDGGPVTELVLARSRSSGPSIRVRTNRNFLRRAIEVGFREVQINKSEAPACCRDDRRCYVWMLLDGTSALAPCPDVLRIASTDARTPLPSPPTKRRNEPMPPSQPQPRDPERRNGAAVPQPERPSGLDGLIGDAEGVRGLLQEAGTRLGRLVVALRQERRQGRAVQSAVAALRQLQLDR